MDLYRRFSLPPLSPVVIKKLKKIEDDKWKSRIERHKKSFQELEKKRRSLKREKYDKDNEKSLYKRSKITKPKKKYVIHKMPKKNL